MALAENEVPTITTEAGSTWNKVEGNWVEFKGKVKEQWGKLTDDDLTQIQGQREQLVGRIQALYGISVEQANKEVTDWENRVVGP
ncbi:MAG: CsbD family protein [Rhodospirillaceae bacterium]|nr:CsbD family protein [Rhodospirillaceae bacterium]